MFFSSILCVICICMKMRFPSLRRIKARSNYVYEKNMRMSVKIAEDSTMFAKMRWVCRLRTMQANSAFHYQATALT